MNDEMSCDNNPWDPRCNTLPKPEIYTAIVPQGNEDYGFDSWIQNFMTYDEAKEWIIAVTKGIGVIHKHHTEIVYFSKEENRDGE